MDGVPAEIRDGGIGMINADVYAEKDLSGPGLLLS